MKLTETQQLAHSLYRDDKGNPVLFTPSQDYLFSAIARRKFNRLHVMSHTRWGKSFTVGLAGLTLASVFPIKIAIIAGTKEKAKVIMNVVNGHIFDNEFTKSRFVLDKGDSVESIRRHRNRSHLTFDTGIKKENKTLLSEMFVGSAKDALGFGADFVIEDESALIDDSDHALVMRMLGDNPHENYMCKIGNPFRRNHFLMSYNDPNYVNVVVDCYASLKEGRISQEIIEENKPYPSFKVLYECKFPSASEVDEKGFMYVFNDEDIKIAQNRQGEIGGERRLGVDVARGGRDFNVWVLRIGNYAKILEKNHDDDLMNTAAKTKTYAVENGVKPKNVFVDDSGIGGGVTDALKNINFNISPVTLGGKAEDAEFKNIRAEIYLGREHLQPWLKRVGRLEPSADWTELTRIRYKKDLTGKIKLESKDDLRKQGIKSPDVADALALTFATPVGGVYHGIEEQINKIVQSGASSAYGGVSW